MAHFWTTIRDESRDYCMFEAAGVCVGLSLMLLTPVKESISVVLIVLHS